ncbi:MAG TPA: cytochrome c oxidase assembly protein [SAR86 cluster bacterium]|nr:cytochrome c oxidase assembly protein [SAR86 cluster bacterium]
MDSKKTIKNLTTLAVGMFAFAFVLVPLYDVFCEITGLNGKVTGTSTLSEESLAISEQRELLVQFITRNNESMPWHFKSEKSQMRVVTGNQYDAIFVFHNKTDKAMVGQVIPSVSPGRGADYFHKTECFCFDQQYLAAGERIELPVRFIVDPALPKEIGSLSLGYTLFDITDRIDATKEVAKL